MGPRLTVTVAPTLVRSRPVAAPVAQTLLKASVPATVVQYSAVADAVGREVSLTATPVRAPVPVMPWVTPVVTTATPLTVALVARATVPCTVAVPRPTVGRGAVPVGGVMPNRASNVLVGEFVAAWPISHSPELSAM